MKVNSEEIKTNSAQRCDGVAVDFFKEGGLRIHFFCMLK